MTIKRTVSRETQWWIDAAQSHGTRLMDMHVPACNSWERVEQTGVADVQRAIGEVGFPTGPSLNLLELGCGAGRMTQAFASHFGSVLGLDVSPELIRIARNRYGCHGIEFRPILCDRLLPHQTSAFDMVFSYEVFHYLQPERILNYLRDAGRLLRNNGCVVVQLNTKPLSRKTRLSRIVRCALNTLGVNSWRGWPTAPEFFHKVYKVDWLIHQFELAGLDCIRVLKPNSRCTWFVAKSNTHDSKSPSGTQ